MTASSATDVSIAQLAATRASAGALFEKFRARQLATPPERLNTGWEDVLVPQGLILGGLLGDTAMADWVRRWVPRHREVVYANDEPGKTTHMPSGTPKTGVVLGQYCGNWGLPMVLVPLFQLDGDKADRDLAVTICDHILTGSPRLRDQGIAHGRHNPGVAERLWVDTLYYTSGPLAWTYSITGDERYAQEAIRQCLVHAKYLQDPRTGLFFHDVEPANGRRSDFFWGRGNGWVIMALLDTLRFCPPTTPGWDAVLASYRDIATGLLRAQHSSGLWRIIPEDEESHLEVSGTAMILIGLLGGIDAGYLQPHSLGRVRRGFWEIANSIQPSDGSLRGAQRPAGLGGWETHRRSFLGECTYADGVLLRLLAAVASSPSFAS